MTFSLFVVFPLFWVASAVAQAAPRIPHDESEILESLPAPISGAQRELRPLREAASRNPGDPDPATQLARAYVEIGRAESDPRYFGYAQAVLSPWWTQANPPADVLLLRGILRQQRHDFDGALNDLGALLRQDPRNAQAWLTRAGILQIRGDPQQALRHCSAVLSQAQHRFAATTCVCKSLSLSGQAARGYQWLRQEIKSSPDAPVAQRLWAWNLLAEIAARLGRLEDAEQHFHRALKVNPRDRYLLMSYADFLLDRAQPERVRVLLAGQTRAESLLLRLAVAEQRLGLEPAMHIAALEAWFDASHRRGDDAHPGEEARLRLHVLNQPASALRLAIKNWQAQREPRDARILLEAALAARDPAAAAPVLATLEQSKLEDVQLVRLADELRSLAP